ncbi:uncharacterized protein LOC128552714 [Mercenaria mercenaria]|uniref:uncharacterized protein LOC128552714 n=1 Tax=Mercenaria mercenaria TaxID=6596 RepID=UPI00234F2C4D|nr:uncharacterized protein LOC128552714 [Mercenaria mercenaria]
MSIERSNKTISEKCKLMTKDALSFKKRFTETDSVLQCLSQMYTALTKEDYEDDWKETKTVSQKDKGKSPTPISHVKFVIEDVCRKISRSSADAVGERCRKHIDQLKETNKQLEEEKMTLLTRLSKFAGANLTDNNPNIADLSDPNRPTKLAEEYSELYDNEWTNAYECLQKSKKSEEDIQTILTNIIKEAYSVCGYIGKRQDTVIRSELLSPGDSYSNETLDKGSQTRKKSARQSAPEKSKDTKDKSKGESLSAVQSKTISELRKQTVTSSASNVISYFKTHPQFKEWFATSSLDSYSVRCIKICWLMNIQNPPVYMEKEVKPGSEFDTSKYKSYTKAGKKLAFVVWPALFLHEGGAILTKGVAQGK